MEKETINQIRDRLVSKLDSSRRNRAVTIARTEAQSVHVGSKNKAAKEIEATHKIWVTSRDPKVRESHAELDGERIKIDEQFSNGLDYPLDPSGEASEIINCRCFAAYEKQKQEE